MKCWLQLTAAGGDGAAVAESAFYWMSENVRGLRIIVAFLVAPLIPGAIVLAPYTYIATLIFGIPAFVMYRRFHLVGVIAYLVDGFLGPVTVFLIFGALVLDATPIQWLVTGAWFGPLTFPATVLFWVIAIWQPRCGESRRQSGRLARDYSGPRPVVMLTRPRSVMVRVTHSAAAEPPYR
jgi:hypothetical protein